MKDRMHRYLREAGGSAPLDEVLRDCAGIVSGSGAVGDSIAGWITEDPRFELDRRAATGGAELRLAPRHDDPDERLLADAPFVVVDLETTGTRSRDGITEIGCVRVRGGLIEDSWSSLVDPGEPIPGRITSITGIDDATVSGQPCLAEALPVFLSFLGEAILVAHNAAFDLRFLQKARRGLQGLEIDNRVLCTVRMARRLLPRLRSRGLDGLAAHLGIRIEARHRALGDARATAEALLRLLELANARGDRTVGELARYAGIEGSSD